MRPAYPERIKTKWQVKEQENARTSPVYAMLRKGKNIAEKPAARRAAVKWKSRVNAAIRTARSHSGNS